MAAKFLAKTHCASSGSDAIEASVNFRHTEVFERSAASCARKSIHGVRATQSAMTLVLASARAISALRPPTDFAQPSASSQSSTHSIEGVLMVSPSKIASLSFPPLVNRKIFGSGHGGTYDSSRATAR